VIRTRRNTHATSLSFGGVPSPVEKWNGRRFLSSLTSNERKPTPVSKRVFPIERVRAAIDQLFASDRELGEVWKR
jgi:hypothetical protein